MCKPCSDPIVPLLTFSTSLHGAVNIYCRTLAERICMLSEFSSKQTIELDSLVPLSSSSCQSPTTASDERLDLHAASCYAEFSDECCDETCDNSSSEHEDNRGRLAVKAKKKPKKCNPSINICKKTCLNESISLQQDCKGCKDCSKGMHAESSATRSDASSNNPVSTAACSSPLLNSSPKCAARSHISSGYQFCKSARSSMASARNSASSC